MLVALGFVYARRNAGAGETGTTVLAPPTPAAAAFTGFAAGYLAYDTIHFATHHASTRSILAREWKRRHFRHHYADSTCDFGVSSPLWDIVLGTRGKGRVSPRD